MRKFELVSEYTPSGDQPEAIKKITERFEAGIPGVVLLGVTGSGKTFTVANVVQNLQRPALVITHNKTLAGQLYAEFREFFPRNAVEYFVSYYDFYQPEAYMPTTDTYIEKDADINEKIDRMRHSATRSLLDRRDVLIVASVSCIYGLGSSEVYHSMMVLLEKGTIIDREMILRNLVAIQYSRTTLEVSRSKFRARGDVLEIRPPYEERIIRIELMDDQIERIIAIDPLSGNVVEELDEISIYPAQHHIAPEERRARAIAAIEEELTARLQELTRGGKLVEAQRLSQRVRYDIEMIREIGYVKGIENYSRHLDARAPGTPPETLLDYFKKDFLLIIDESHITVPQLNGMYNGDFSRKSTLVEYGFRLPSALDNRPLKFEEFLTRINQTMFVSATPGDYEMERFKKYVVEQIIRPTGLVDPEILVLPTRGQLDDLITRIRERVARSERVLVTTLTKRMAEDLCRHLGTIGLAVAYLHSEIETLERMEIIRDLRLKKYDVLVGINLLREGLDLPEVSLVAILDADKEGFLRSTRSLIQTAGRASRNLAGQVVFYADRITDSMKNTMDETDRRRTIQLAYNLEHGITPKSIQSAVREAIYKEEEEAALPEEKRLEQIANLELSMRKAAEELDFEAAARYRDELRKLGGFKEKKDEGPGSFEPKKKHRRNKNQ